MDFVLGRSSIDRKLSDLEKEALQKEVFARLKRNN